MTRTAGEAKPVEVRAQHASELVWRLANGEVAARCLQVVAELGVADRIEEAPVSVAALASSCTVDVDALDRILRLLAVHGVFERDADGYVHTPASRLLRSDSAGSMRPYARLRGMPLLRRSLSGLDRSVRTGRPALDAVESRGLWAYLHEHPDEAEVFDRAMSGKAVAGVAGVLASYDFGGFTTIVDVGGGRGHLLRAVLDAAPSASGVLFDLPEVIQRLEIRHPRMTTVAGSFFVDPVPSGDAYVLMDVLHDWPNEKCETILRAVRAAPAGATLLVVEAIVPDGPVDPRTATLDVTMLVLTGGGRERTAGQLETLFTRSGFVLESVLDTPGPVRIAEARTV
jgi:hypothetical protein